MFEFEFSWARLGIFFAIFFGVPLLGILFFIFKEWVERSEERIMWFGGGCVIFMVAILAAFVAFLK